MLLDDSESQVQREALRAILDIGTDAAYSVLQRALVSGTAQSREAIMRSIALLRDERATPLFAYIVGHVDHRGPLLPIYLTAIESLGALHDPAGVQALKDALHRGEWWAPRRTARLRAAAADALARVATPEAISVLREAAESPSRAAAKISGTSKGGSRAVSFPAAASVASLEIAAIAAKEALRNTRCAGRGGAPAKTADRVSYER